MRGINLLAIADMHSTKRSNVDILSQVETKVDCICLLGDNQSTYFYHLKELFPKAKIFGILGNHDYPALYDRYNFITNVHKECTHIGRYSIAGFEGIQDREQKLDLGYTQDQVSEAMDQLPKADILISHTSPLGIHQKNTYFHCGFRGIKNYIEKHQPLLHLHGHMHENEISKVGETLVVGVYGTTLIKLPECRISRIIDKP